MFRVRSINSLRTRKLLLRSQRPIVLGFLPLVFELLLSTGLWVSHYV